MMNYPSIDVKFTCSTNGRGYWSDVIKSVQCTKIELAYISNDGRYAELRVYFDIKTWNVENDGLIYTDKQFLSQLHLELSKLGFSETAVHSVVYSEQGMQGDDFVSFDVCHRVFIQEFLSQTLSKV